MTTAVPLSLPSSSPETLLVQDGARLAAEDQRQLLQWVSDHPEVQIVTTASESLVPLVVSGAFLEALYYRLNVMYLDLGATSGETNRTSATRVPRIDHAATG